MIINIKAKKDRQKTAEQPSKKGCGSSHGSDQESMFRKALNDALKKCKLMKTYDEALPKWHMATSLVQQMGCPLSPCDLERITVPLSDLYGCRCPCQDAGCVGQGCRRK